MSAIFPTTYSTLSAEALAAFVTEKYQLPGLHGQFLTRGVGDTYLLQNGDTKYILRVYRASHRNLEQIKAEVALLQALHQFGVSVARPISDHTGATIQTLHAAEGERHAVLFTYAPGESVRALTDS